MTYYVVGRLYVERWAPEGDEEVGGYEILYSNASCDTPLLMKEWN